MKKLKLIGAVSAISILGLGGLVISTALASCSQTYSIDMTSIKGITASSEPSNPPY
jgi:hypothetical protein